MPEGSSSPRPRPGIARLTVGGFKSIAEPQSIQIRPLTILAGPNSSGKSSMLQPLLLLKQTLEVSYDPGPMLLDGPNVRFTSLDQILSHRPPRELAHSWLLHIGAGRNEELKLRYGRTPQHKLDLLEMTLTAGNQQITMRPGMSHDELSVALATYFPIGVGRDLLVRGLKAAKWSAPRERCFLGIAAERDLKGAATPSFFTSPASIFARNIVQIIHLPGLRGNPERTYPITAASFSSPRQLFDTTSALFPGTFERYFASVILSWQNSAEDRKLSQLGRDLESLGLTWTAQARPLTDTSLELRVGRLPRKGRLKNHDTVSVADVGLGISQSLPVVVALLVAEPGQLVYLEQPETHLHPKAQLHLASLFARAASRGVNVVIETHSSLILRGIQTLIPKGELRPELVKLHWFTRSKQGNTIVHSADLDSAGAFGKWPEDFDDVTLEAERAYLDATALSS